MIQRYDLIYGGVREWLTTHRKTLDWLSKECEVSYAQLYNLVTGRIRNKPSLQCKLAETLGEDFFTKYPEQCYQTKNKKRT